MQEPEITITNTPESHGAAVVMAELNNSQSSVGYGRLVREFDKLMGLSIDVAIADKKEIIDHFSKCYRLIEDEHRELKQAYMKFMNMYLLKFSTDPTLQWNQDEYKKMLLPMLDALADIIYTCVHMSTTIGQDIDAIFLAVHSNNMTKVGEDGKPVRADGATNIDPETERPFPKGKILKPKNYKPVDFSHLVK